MNCKGQNFCLWLLVALALCAIAAFVTASILSNKASEKLDSLDAGSTVGGLLSGILRR